MRQMRQVVMLLIGAAFALLASAQVQAQTPAPAPIKVEHPWARATPGGAKTGAAYMTLINSGDSSDELVGATTPVSDKIQFHTEVEEHGVSRMREQSTVEIAPRATVTFKPGAMHMMLVRLKQPLKDGQTFPLELDFKKAGKINVTVSVAKVGAMEHGNMGPMTHEPADTMKR